MTRNSWKRLADPVYPGLRDELRATRPALRGTITAAGVGEPARLQNGQVVKAIEFVASEKQVGKGHGGKNEDDEFFDLEPDI